MSTSEPASSATSAGAEPEVRVWHRHPVVLVETIGLPSALLTAILVAGVVAGGWSSWPARLVMFATGALSLARGVALLGEPPPDARTPVGQRRTVLRRVTRPVEVAAVLAALGLVALSLLSLFLASVSVHLSLPIIGGILSHSPPALLFIFYLALWIALNTIDWHNDIYILTADRIIDQVRVPLLYDQRTEARLDQVQNVTAAQGFLGGLLGYGNVVVETAGRTQSVVFEQVGHPQYIQQVIFDRLSMLRARREEEQRRQEAERLGRWFSVYHDLATRVTLMSARDRIPLGGRLRVGWRVSGPPDEPYRTFLLWDRDSHRVDNAYANATPLLSNDGPGWFRDWLVPETEGRIYFKACAQPTGGDLYCSEEAAADVIGGSQNLVQ